MSEPTKTHLPEPDNATLTRTPDAGTSAGTAEVAAPPGYELLGEIGSGGMGIVYRARDLDLAREVAVKVLLPQFTPDSATARRFVDEARITGRLQHPGIPAIYRVGTLNDGRPFLAMKLIGGQTLDELLKVRTDPSAKSAQSLTDFEQVANQRFDRLAAMLESGRFLAIFEKVAQAVGYAHQEGVIHRDLKPANVMVGAFGEVQVMDWGIARSGDRKQETSDGGSGEPTATIAYLPNLDARTPQSDLTQAGAILGTPAYMPPEQAIGAIDQIGKPSDVFGLGAILCVILTGKPPYAAADAESNRQLAARAKLDDAFARLDKCSAEPELVALAKRCLAPEPKDRPRDAGEVAEEVAALRADSERRARQAEMDRARAEVKTAEERKRRRVQRALALSVLGLLAVAGVAAWWIDSVRSQRRADQEANELRREAEQKELEAERKTRQLAYERDVESALDEVRLRLREGHEQAEDTVRWGVTLRDAGLAMKRAEKLLESGEPTEELRRAVAAKKDQLELEHRDLNLILALDRAADSNEIQLLMPISFSSVTSRQFATAFRTHGIDLLAVPQDEAVAWLKKQRLRNRLVIAIRNWQQSFPLWDVEAMVSATLFQAVDTSAAVAGAPAVGAFLHDPDKRLEILLRKSGSHARLGAILKAVTDDPFTREWWEAVERKDKAALTKLLARPELGRMTSRELSSLAEGLNPMSGLSSAIGPCLDIAHERFPGEFWVHFRMAFQLQFGDKSPDPNNGDKAEEEHSHRHLTAALAIRPNSAIARAALGMVLIERRKDEVEELRLLHSTFKAGLTSPWPHLFIGMQAIEMVLTEMRKHEAAGLRLLHSAAKADPTSPWPHLFVGMQAMEKGKGDWPEAFRAMKESIRVDPDLGFFMMSSTALYMLSNEKGSSKTPTDRELVEFFNELIAIQPKHPGGYDALGMYYYQSGDHRSALVTLRKSKEFVAPDYPGRVLTAPQLTELEAKARWEGKIPDVLTGKILLMNVYEIAEFAGYCATFERKYALAAGFVSARLKANPEFFDGWSNIAKFAGWAVQAGAGNGTDTANLTPNEREQFRKQALAWLRESAGRARKEVFVIMGQNFAMNADFAAVRDAKELAKLPPDERAEWEKFWAELAPVFEKPKPKAREVASPPREK